jgi:glycerate-2-kinase
VSDDRARLERIFRAALAAADPARALRARIAGEGEELRILGDPVPAGARVHLFAAGKAAAPMALVAEGLLGRRCGEGLVVTKDGHGVAGLRSALRESGHPVPDARSEAAGREALRFVARLPSEDLLLVLLSGGASSLLSCPVEGVSREDLAETTRLLLGSGAAIDALNAVRKHLCAAAGGRLALACAARACVVLAVSDVAGDRIDVIGSGPFAPDPTTFRDAVGVLRERGLWSSLPGAVREVLEAGVRGERPETPGPGAPQLERVRHAVLAGNATALAAACDAARAEGLAPFVEECELEGEAREVGAALATRMLEERPRRPRCWLAGGETTVTLRGHGAGGRCQELALAAARVLDGSRGVTLLAAGTDGSDGPTDAAGAFADGGTCARARARGEDPDARLADNDSYAFFAAEGGLLRTGPTGTNVRDLVLAIAHPVAG